MKKITVLLCLCLVSACIFSCKKTSSEDPASQVKTILKAVTQCDSSGTNVTQIFEYDAEGRLLSSKVHDTVVYSLTYSQGKVELELYSEPGVLWAKVTYYLDQTGLASSSVWTFPSVSNNRPSFNRCLYLPFYVSKATATTADTSREYYFYNQSGYLVNSIYSSAYMSDTSVYVIQDGNTVSQSHVSGTYSSTTNYTFFLDHLNTIDAHNNGIFFLGQDDKNPLKKSSSPAWTEEFTYDYDSFGRVTRQQSSELDHWYLFTYTD